MALEPNNKLLNYDFETYRVSLKKLQTLTKELNCELYDWNPKTEGSNFSQIKAFGIHNNLFLDHIFPNNVYLISKQLEIFRVTVIESPSNSLDVTMVYKSSFSTESVLRRVSPVLFFPSTSIKCFFDGIKSLHVIHTNNKSPSKEGDTSQSWENLCCSDVDSFSNCDLTLLECRVQVVNTEEVKTNVPLSGEILHCCFLKVYDTTYDKNVELIWKKFNYCHILKGLIVLETKTWRGATPPEMVTFTKDFKSLEIVEDHSFRYIPEGLTAATLTEDNIKTMASWWQESNEFISVHYYVNMSADDFTIDIVYPEDIDKELVILFKVKDMDPLELYRQKMNSSFDKNISKWYLENEMLIIELKKIDSEQLEDVAAKKSKVSFEQYEDVDNCDDVDLALVSLDAITGCSIEEISISKNEWLFSTRLEATEPLSVCVRYNVDGLILSKGDFGTHWTHKHTLNAFGYVSAAKVDRKFIICSLPEYEENGIKFVAMSDWKRSVCVFMQNKEMDQDMSVKNRNTGKVIANTADEFFVTFEKCTEIMGIVANKTMIFVLYRTSDEITNVSMINCA